MKDYSYTYSDFNFYECQKAMNTWINVKKDDLLSGKTKINSIDIHKEKSENIYYPDKWYMTVCYSEKIINNFI